MSLEYSSCEVANILKAVRSAIFCGAGISYNSGLPVVSELLHYLFSKLELPAEEQKLILDSDMPFESIMETVMHESSLDEIVEIFKAGSPNVNHVFIAKLAKNGYLNIILTTNFDILIEKALEQEGLYLDRDFNVYSSESDLKSIMWDNPRIKIIKIHGCASKKEDMVITMAMIASDQYSEMRREVMNAIFSGSRCDSVLVMGYSCSDLDLTPLIESLDCKKANIQFIDHLMSATGGADTSKYEPVSSKLEKNPFKQYNGSRHYINTDVLVKNLWKLLLNDEYITHTVPISNWRRNIDDWYLNSVGESGEGVKHHIASRLLYSIGEFRKAIGHHKKAISIAIANKNTFAYAAETGNLGMALCITGEYEQARFYLEKSIPLCKRGGYTENLATQLQAMGTLLHRTGNDIDAIKAHKEALKYAEAQKDESLISTILGNISNSYNKTGQLNLAKKSIENALVLSRKLGNKQSESSQLGIIALTHFLEGNIDLAIDCCLKAIEIKRTIADRHGECQLLLNLTSLYNNSGRKQEASVTGRKCQELAKAIGNKQVEEMMNLMLMLF